MNRLITIVNPFPDIKMIEVFEPEFRNGIALYPVKVDGLLTMFENVDIYRWTAKGMAAALTPEVIQYIGDIIEDKEL